MAKKNSFTIKFQGDIDRLKRFLDPKKGLNKSIERHIKKATIKNSMILIARIRQAIRGRKYVANRKVTELIKGERKPPLIDSGMLHNAITKQIINSFQAKVGVLDGKFAELAGRVHEGFVMRITPKQRAAIFGQIRVEHGQEGIDSLPDKKSDGFLRVQGRPFLQSVFDDPVVIEELDKNWELAVKNAILEASKGLAPE